MLTEATLLEALEAVKDPDLGQSIVKMGMIREIAISDGGAKLAFTCELTTPACPLREQIEKDIRGVIGAKFPEVKQLDLKMTGKVRTAGAVSAGGENLAPQLKNVIMVGGGKGGVGKSTLAVNLAYALKRLGARTSLLDLDIYAPALPELIGLHKKPNLQGQDKIQPHVHRGMEVMSMGFLVDRKQPMLWRGPVVAGIVAQFLRDVLWSEADYLVVDLPPGNTDVPLTLAQSCAASGAVVVVTPQTLSHVQAVRVRPLYDQLRVPVLGVIANMSGWSENGAARPLFPDGGLAALVESLGVPLLAELPFAPDLAQACERGEILVEARPDSDLAKTLILAAERLAAQVSVRSLEREKSQAAAAPSPGVA
ncbi:MAG: Mrp/NBP35 family ATP-binding protein [Planctomycetota bacterium]|nr:Mrp/NBP35 family ATP-binding protein [Planctomycetota bacterium]